jgi:hypothetical protein
MIGHQPLPGSIAIDHGPTIASGECEEEDQGGVPRSLDGDGVCDTGALE